MNKNCLLLMSLLIFYHLHNIKRIRKYLSRESTEMLVHAFITSHVDYCKSSVWAAQLPA